MSTSLSKRWSAVYEIDGQNRAQANEIARAIALEQTIEYPYELVEGTWIARELVGRVETLTPCGEYRWRTEISYPTEAVGGDFLQFLNMIYGNSSLQPNVRLIDLKLNTALVQAFPGARYGIEGLRRAWQVPTGPFLMAVLKPLGHTATEFAQMAYHFALGGCHAIKDDHNLHNQRWAPFAERVRCIATAVTEANEKSGGHSVYLANVMATGSELFERALLAQELGADGVMISPTLAGWGAVKELSGRTDFHLPIILHPSFSGTALGTGKSGIAHGLYNGYLPRLAGADSVIFTSFGGRFEFSPQDCKEAQDGCLSEWYGLPPILPSAGGGVTLARLPELSAQFGENIMYLVGGDLFRHSPDLEVNARCFSTALKELHEAH